MNWAALRNHITAADSGTALTLLSVLALIALSPLFGSHWFFSHELNDPLQRVIALAHEMRNGDLYPRWISAGFHGQGLPFFNYYSPGFYMIAGWLYTVGIPLTLAMKLVVWLAFTLGAYGVYLWTRVHVSNQAALLAAIIYLFIPYHFVDLYVRGAMSEFTALALLPYLFYGIDLSFKKHHKGVLITAISSAAIVVTHNLSAAMIIPLASGYVIIQAIQHKASLRTLGLLCLGPIIGALLSAFYWLPVIAERSYIPPLENSMATGYYTYQKHFISFSEWFDFDWGFAPFRAGYDAPMNFQLGAILLIFLITSLLAIENAPAQARRFALSCFALGLFGLVMTSPLADPTYQLITPLQMIQFPWRFMGPTTLFLTAFCSLAIYAHRHRAFPAIAITAAIIIAIVASSEQRQLFRTVHITPEYAASGLIEERGIAALAVKNEYLPIWAKGYKNNSLTPFAEQHNTVISELSTNASRMRFQISSPGTQPSTITIPWHYFPGWLVTIDGSPVEITPSSYGFISFTAPAGMHKVAVKFGTTPPRQIGWLLAVIGLLLLLTIHRWLPPSTTEQSPHPSHG